jgi:hypothetical protein
MILNAALFVSGLVLAVMTLRDVFETVVVPGGSRTSLRVAHRLRTTLLPLWKSLRGRRQGISGAFAPVILVSSFIIWMSLLAVGFGLMAYAARAHFQPPLEGFGQAVYVVGSSLVTVGLSHTNPAGASRWIVLAAGFCGLGVMTMAVTYLLEVQSSVARRDTGVIKLNTAAGEPPSALALLERFAAIGNQAELHQVLREARDWCASVRQSHAAHPSLIYFQSIGTGAGWPAALGAVLDLALFAEQLIDESSLHGPAVLLREEGERMAKQLALISAVRRTEARTDENMLRTVTERLALCGYPIRKDANFHEMGLRRTEYASCVDALAQHLGKPAAVLLRR